MWRKLGRKQKGVIVLGAASWALIVFLSIENPFVFGEFSEAVEEIYTDWQLYSAKVSDYLMVIAVTAAVAGVIIAIAVYMVPGDHDEN